MADLVGKVVLVAGGDKGIGKGVAVELLRAGAEVAVTYYASEEGARDVVAQAHQLGRRSLALPANLTLVEEARRAVQATVGELGRLDVLVYNAGITDPHPFLDLTEAQYDATLAVNLKGACFCCQAAARAMIAAEVPGSIVVISSLHSFLSFPEHAHYAASKAGLNQLVRTIANELAPYGIRVNAIAPGMIEVERYQELFAPYDPTAWGQTIPLGRVGYPRDVAGAVIFLASEAADYITGTVLRVDGGLLTRSPHYPPAASPTYPSYRQRRPGG